MSTVNVTMRVDDELKKEADELFTELGMNLSTAFNIFLRQSVREQKIPFTISRKMPSEKLLTALEEVEDPEKLNGPYDDVKSLMEALNA